MHIELILDKSIQTIPLEIMALGVSGPCHTIFALNKCVRVTGAGNVLNST